MLNFKATKEEHMLISAIAKRAVEMAAKQGKEYPMMDAVMDINACHSNGCPLKLAELLEAPPFDFAHDVFGIYRHINRQTGQLEDCFLPRYARPAEE